LVLVALALFLVQPPMELTEMVLHLVPLQQLLVAEAHLGKQLTTPQAVAVQVVAALSLLETQQGGMEPVGKVMLAVVPPVVLVAVVVVALEPQVAMVVQVMVAMAVLPLQVLFLALLLLVLAVVVVVAMLLELLGLAVVVVLVTVERVAVVVLEVMQQPTQALVAVAAEMTLMAAMVALELSSFVTLTLSLPQHLQLVHQQ
jgi:hypothetical protein